MYIHYLYKFRASESRFNTFTDRRPGTASQAPSEDCNAARRGSSWPLGPAVTGILNAAREHYHQQLSSPIIPHIICFMERKWKRIDCQKFGLFFFHLREAFKNLLAIIENVEKLKANCIYKNNISSFCCTVILQRLLHPQYYYTNRIGNLLTPCLFQKSKMSILASTWILNKKGMNVSNREKGSYRLDHSEEYGYVVSDQSV